MAKSATRSASKSASRTITKSVNSTRKPTEQKLSSRSQARLHTLRESAYREKPYFRTMRFLIKPKRTLAVAWANSAQPEIRTVKHVRLKTRKDGPTPTISFLKDFKLLKTTTATYDPKPQPGLPRVRTHEQWFWYKPNENGHLHKDSLICVSCDCAHAKYATEYNNAHKHGLSPIYFSNGDPPIVKPRRAALCKHTLRVAETLLREALAADAAEGKKVQKVAQKGGAARRKETVGKTAGSAAKPATTAKKAARRPGAKR